ncbi:hypothetical protein [Providencia sp.]|uniref:hypothetical protein n=1 Tax=Providencia sp. TaxID=589 RepID=UPI00333FE3BD
MNNADILRLIRNLIRIGIVTAVDGKKAIITSWQEKLIVGFVRVVQVVFYYRYNRRYLAQVKVTFFYLY